MSAHLNLVRARSTMLLKHLVLLVCSPFILLLALFLIHCLVVVAIAFFFVTFALGAANLEIVYCVTFYFILVYAFRCIEPHFPFR